MMEVLSDSDDVIEENYDLYSGAHENRIAETRHCHYIGIMKKKNVLIIIIKNRIHFQTSSEMF